MVNPIFRPTLPAALVLCVIVAAAGRPAGRAAENNAAKAASTPGRPAPSPAVPTGWLDYKIGDVAKEDIMAPVPLVVIDPEDTLVLKEKEASRVPVICRFYTNAIDQAQAELEAAFIQARSNFLDRVEVAFNRRQLTATDLELPKFQRLVASFQRQNRSFPATTNLAQTWALGAPEDAPASSLVATLRQAMALPLRPANISPDVRFGASVRLVPLADWNEAPTLEMAEKRGTLISRSNILTITRARETLLAGFSPDERATAKFLGSLLKTNCVPDSDLTREARAKRTDPIWAADHYEAAQVIVRRGQTIDRKIKAALDQIREKTAIMTLQQQLRYDQLESQQATRRHRWLLAGLVAVLVGLFLIAWRLSGRRQVVSLLPAPVPSGQSTTTIVYPSSVPAVSGAAADDMRARLLPYLAGLLKEKLVRKLLAQRTDLLDTQQKAAADIAELEARLQQVHTPLQDRLRAYEQRIHDLQKELAQKGEENRELIKAKIQATRKQLATEKAKGRLNLN